MAVGVPLLQLQQNDVYNNFCFSSHLFAFFIFIRGSICRGKQSRAAESARIKVKLHRVRGDEAPAERSN